MSDAVARQHGDAAAGVWQGKARTLLRIAPRLKHSRVPESMCVGYSEWCQSRRAVLERVRDRFGAAPLAIRSSARDEDGNTPSAGHYRTVLDVASGALVEVATAIDAVFHSYGAPVVADEVLVQAMATQITHSFVASTHAIDDQAPYYTLSFVAGAQCDAVTRGSHAATTVYIARNAAIPTLEAPCASVLGALRELESLFPDVPIESEMVVTSAGVALLQVRPLPGPRNAQPDEVFVARRRLTESLKTDGIDESLAGSRRLFGQMPDWNPAELLGSHPRPLALSLFRQVISRRTWRDARAQLGYRRIERGDLLRAFAGRPYVDVRLSFNSFLPHGIDDDLSNRVVDAWMDRLRTNPHLHDKVEFEVATTCLDFDWLAQWRQRYGDFSVRDLRRFGEALATPTQNCLDPLRLGAAMSSIRQLRSEPAEMEAALVTAESAAHPFATIARQAFAAEAVMRSAARRGAFGIDRLHAMRAFAQHGQEKTGDVGRLRPGTFEISVPSYAERGDTAMFAHEREQRIFEATAAEKRAFARLCSESALSVDADTLLELYRSSIRAREHAKFILSLLISNALERLRAHGVSRGLDRETLVWLDLDTLLDERNSAAALHDTAAGAKLRHEVEHRLKLPALFDDGEDFDVVRCPPGQPTFQGRGIVEARIVAIDAYTRSNSLPRQCIVAVENADPGYDWIFSREPLALVTAFGGPNSHMAIRCAESGCGAVLGLGAEAFHRFARTPRATIDFDTQTIETAR